jgi:hypothetical protein
MEYVNSHLSLTLIAIKLFQILVNKKNYKTQHVGVVVALWIFIPHPDYPPT